MAFSIDNLLKKQMSSKEPSSANASEDGRDVRNATEILPFAFPWAVESRGRLDSGESVVGNSSAAAAAVISPVASSLTSQQLPTLADLQLLFGGGGPKAHYRRNRRSGADRKPRQAYSSKQLEKLEDEFKKDKYLSVSKRVDLSKSLNLSETQIKTWFQNRRTKWKKQVTASLRQLYRHGLYSQYAAAAAAANPACFLPMMAPPPGIFDPLNGIASDHQPGTSAMHPNGPWTVPSNMFLGIPALTQSSLFSAPSSSEHEGGANGRSASSASSCSEASSILAG